jgi:Ras-related GTP-binding protein A/B
MENYFTTQRDNVFRNVEVLIYVFDVESREVEKDMHYYQSCLEAILQNSPGAKVFCLIHKMDLIPEDQRKMVSLVLPPSTAPHTHKSSLFRQIFDKREAELMKRSLPLECACFKTSIWDETLYKVSLIFTY